MKSGYEAAIHNYMSTEARHALADAIARAGGAEVFAVGRCDRNFVVIDVSILAIGHMTAAPVVSSSLMRGQVVLHNHPSGELMPSDADLEVAAGLAQKGIGFWIVDNAVERLRPVTDPMSNASGTIVLQRADIEHLFSDHGLLAIGYPGYEPRPGQRLMALKVTDALSSASHLVIEAGTGTGKSLAYLAPAVLWAERNEARIVVSTNTINLQEQLVSSDLPALARALGQPIEACLVKGRSNYLCLRKLDRALSGMDSVQSDQLAPIVAWALDTTTGDKSSMPMEPPPEAWEAVCAEADLCLAQRCPRYRECFFYGARRKMESARVLVTNHHLLFADVSIRMQLGQGAERAVLPGYRAVVLDEAHNAADVATEYFGKQASRLGGIRLLNQVFRKELRAPASTTASSFAPSASTGSSALVADVGAAQTADSGGGVLARARGLISARWGEKSLLTALKRAHDIIDFDAIPTALRCRDLCENFFSELRTLVVGGPGLAIGPGAGHGSAHPDDSLFGESPAMPSAASTPASATGSVASAAAAAAATGGSERQLRIGPDLKASDVWDRRVYPAHEACASSLDELAEHLSRLAKALDADDDAGAGAGGSAWAAEGTPSGDAEAALLMELKAYSGRASTMAQAIRFAVKADSADFVYWVEVSGRGPRSNVRLVAAPIETGPEIARALLPNVDTAVFTSATLAVGDDFSYTAHSLGLDTLEPDRVGYAIAPSPFDFASQALLLVADDMPEPDAPLWEERLAPAIAALLDASNGRAFVLFTSYRLLQSMAARLGPHMKQKGMRLMVQGDKPRKTLLDEFRADVGSVLFGTDSFWEGVDVPGEALSCVVIPRLPFAVPTAPVMEARVEAIRARGGDAFSELALPAAVLKFKQGFGRLIRTSSDTGAVAVLDSRVLSRGYGRFFIDALPDCAKRSGSIPELAAALRDWLSP